MASPMKAAMPYLNQIPGVEQQYLGPYAQQGQQAYQTLQPQYESMATHPQDLINSIMGSYQSSPGFQALLNRSLQSAANTAAAGGERGSLYDINNQANLTNALMGQDMQQWLQNVLGVKQMGLGGEQGFYQTGYDASRGMASDLSNLLNEEGSLAFQQARQDQSNPFLSNLINSLAQGVGGGIGAGLLGGPGGAAAGFLGGVSHGLSGGSKNATSTY